MVPVDMLREFYESKVDPGSETGETTAQEESESYQMAYRKALEQAKAKYRFN